MMLHQLNKARVIHELYRNISVSQLSTCRQLSGTSWKTSSFSQHSHGTRRPYPRLLSIPHGDLNCHRLRQDIRFMSGVSPKEKEEVQGKHKETIDSLLKWCMEETKKNLKLIPIVSESLLILIQENVNLKEEVLKNEYFKQFCTVVEEHHNSFKHSTIVDLLTLYTELQSKDSRVTEELLKYINFNLYSMKKDHLEKVKQILTQHQETILRRNCLKEIEKTSTQFWESVDKSSSQDIVSLMYSVYDPKVVMSTKDRALKMTYLEKAALLKVEEMNVVELYKVFYNLTKQKQRNLSLMKEISHKLMAKNFSFPMTKLLGMLNCCYVLRYRKHGLIKKITDSVVYKLPKEQDSYIVAQLAHTLSCLHWYDEDLQNILAERWSRLTGDIPYSAQTIKELYMLFNSFAIHSSLPRNIAEKDMDTFLDPIKGAYYEKEPFKWLFTVYTAGLVGRLTPQLAESVLNPHFIQRISDSSFFIIQVTKLLMVNACAICDVENYEGPKLDEASIKKYAKQPRGSKGSLESIFALMTSSPNCVRTNTLTSLGYVLDFEIQVNENLELQPFKEDKSNEQFQRIALQELNSIDYLGSSDIEIGRIRTMKRHLEALGYIYVPIHTGTFLELQTDDIKIMALKGKIQEAYEKQKKKTPISP